MIPEFAAERETPLIAVPALRHVSTHPQNQPQVHQRVRLALPVTLSTRDDEVALVGLFGLLEAVGPQEKFAEGVP